MAPFVPFPVSQGCGSVPSERPLSGDVVSGVVKCVKATRCVIRLLSSRQCFKGAIEFAARQLEVSLSCECMCDWQRASAYIRVFLRTVYQLQQEAPRPKRITCPQEVSTACVSVNSRPPPWRIRCYLAFAHNQGKQRFFFI